MISGHLKKQIAASRGSAVIGRVFRRLGVQLNWVNTRSMLVQPPQRSVPSDKISIRDVTLEECLAACSDPALALDAEFVREAFARNRMCHAAFSDGRMLCYS